MGVHHILKDGTTVDDIAGKVVRPEDAGPLYQLIHKINRGGSGKKSNTYNQNKREVRA